MGNLLSAGGADVFIGVDVGGTTIQVGAVDAEGHIYSAGQALQSVPLGDDHDPAFIVQRIHGVIKDVLEAAGLRFSDVKGVGICTPGLLDCEAGVVHACANLKGWKGVPLVDLLAQELGIARSAVALENDTNAALLAEVWTGAAVGQKNVVLMTLGTGVGGAVMCDGRLLRGSRGHAGEIGHAILFPDGRSHGGTGVKGIVEAYASATAVAARAKEGLDGKGPPSGSVLARSGKEIECIDVFQHAAAGDAYARQIVQETGRCLAITCINCARFVDPDLILLGGGMAEAGDLLLEEVRKYFAQYHWNIEPVRVEIKQAHSGNTAGLIGAARAACVAHNGGGVQHR